MFSRDPKTAKFGEEILPLDVGYLPDFFQKKAEVELNYTQSVRENSLRELKKALTNDITLKDFQFADAALLSFLNSKKYDIDRTVSKLKMYVNFRKKNMYLYTNIKFEEMLPILSSKVINILPWRCHDGCVIILIQLGNWDSKKIDFICSQKVWSTVLTQTCRDPMTVVNGYKIIIDFKISLDVLKLFTPRNVYLFYNGTEVAFPGRVKGYHILNMGVLGSIAWHPMTYFMSEKMRKRVHIHKGFDTLLDFFPKAVLPVEYGGDLIDYDMTEWIKKATTEEELSILGVLSS